MEKIGKEIRKIINNKEPKITPVNIPPIPENRCRKCGQPHEYNWTDNEFLLKVNGKAVPCWLKVDCKTCEQAEKLKKKKIEDERIFQRRLEKTGLKARYRAKTFSNYQTSSKSNQKGQKEAFMFCKNFATNFKNACRKGTFLLLAGNPGTGKGHFAAAIISEVTRQGYSAIFIKAREMFRMIKETWRSENGARESELVKKLCNTDLLVIDDIGVQFGSQTEQDLLYDILDGRYEDYRSTVCVTNLTFPAFEELIGERLLDRFFDTESKSRIVMCDWESYRRREI